MPPIMKFKSEMWHPNSNKIVPYKLNIFSKYILMALFAYQFYIHQEKINLIHKKAPLKGIINKTMNKIFLIRWRPVLGVEQILISVLSMLSSANIDSPANIDAAVDLNMSYNLLIDYFRYN